MDELMQEFLAEVSESLTLLDGELVKFEQNPDNAEILTNIFRVMHTIKGTCGFLGLARLEKVAHAGEDVLGKFRDGELTVTPEAVSLILECIDRIRDLVAGIAETGREADGEDAELIASLRAMAAGEYPASDAPKGRKKSATAAAPVTGTEAGESSAQETPEAASDEPVLSDDGFPVAAELLTEVEQALNAGDSQTNAIAIAVGALDDVAIEGLKSQPAARPEAEAAGVEVNSAKSSAHQTIRVSVDVLENLMTLVSELVLTRNNLLQMVRSRNDSEFAEPVQRLSLITSDLQQGVMKTRMQPVGNAWAQLPRIVRNLAMDTGKKLDLQMLGSETELDRQVLELIRDPLTHMVRNSADHGIEGPKERLAAGKPETGRLALRAYHEGGHIIIEVSDDGKGLDTDRVRRKALENGLATEAELEAMTEAQIHHFIFKPGFSTAEKVTSVSGRGVGLDVVRSNIEKIGGTIELKSVKGLGSSFTIKIPLTLAIVSALVVACGEDRYAVPQLNVRELVRVSPSSEQVVEMVNEAPVLRLRNRLLPLVSLRALLGSKVPEGASEDSYFVVVTQVGAQSFGIIVDQVFDTEEIVVKPVSRLLRKVPVYSGNTILGDGSVVMILDPNGIAASMGQNAVSATSYAAAAASCSRRTRAISWTAGFAR